jgi:hypothetical protein
MGRRYETSEWVEFFTEPGKPRVSTKRLASKFSNAVWRKFNAWADDTSGVDKDSLAYKTYASIVGHGIGLWDGELFVNVGLSRYKADELGKKLDAAMKKNPALSRMAHKLDDLISMAREADED